MPTALIVDDEPEANKLLAMLIELRGYRTISALTGADAIAAIESTSPDVVFLDLMLPDIPGYEVCRQIKGRSATALIPVVMVTARVAFENRVQGFRVGADEYVAKPYTPEQIYEALDEARGWVDALDRPPRGTAISFQSDADGQTLRGLSRLRNLLVATTPLDDAAVGRIYDALESLWASAAVWGRRHRVEHVADLLYDVCPDRAMLTLRDASQWFPDDPRPARERWPRALGTHAFDEIEDRGGGPVVLTKRFPADSPS